VNQLTTLQKFCLGFNLLTIIEILIEVWLIACKMQKIRRSLSDESIFEEYSRLTEGEKRQRNCRKVSIGNTVLFIVFIVTLG